MAEAKGDTRNAAVFPTSSVQHARHSYKISFLRKEVACLSENKTREGVGELYVDKNLFNLPEALSAMVRWHKSTRSSSQWIQLPWRLCSPEDLHMHPINHNEADLIHLQALPNCLKAKQSRLPWTSNVTMTCLNGLSKHPKNIDWFLR